MEEGVKLLDDPSLGQHVNQNLLRDPVAELPSCATPEFLTVTHGDCVITDLGVQQQMTNALGELAELGFG